MRQCKFGSMLVRLCADCGAISGVLSQRIHTVLQLIHIVLTGLSQRIHTVLQRIHTVPGVLIQRVHTVLTGLSMRIHIVPDVLIQRTDSYCTDRSEPAYP